MKITEDDKSGERNLGKEDRAEGKERKEKERKKGVMGEQMYCSASEQLNHLLTENNSKYSSV